MSTQLWGKTLQSSSQRNSHKYFRPTLVRYCCGQHGPHQYKCDRQCSCFPKFPLFLWKRPTTSAGYIATHNKHYFYHLPLQIGIALRLAKCWLIQCKRHWWVWLPGSGLGKRNCDLIPPVFSDACWNEDIMADNQAVLASEGGGQVLRMVEYLDWRVIQESPHWPCPPCLWVSFYVREK